MRNFIKSKPIYPFILSLFFVFHGYTENFDLIPVGDILTLFLFYLLISVVLLAVTRLVYRNWDKAALVSFILMAFYFFFGAIYDTINNLWPGGFLGKYSVILSSYLLFLIGSSIYIFRYKNSLHKLNYVLNIFFVLLILVDSLWLVTKLFQPNDVDNTAGKTLSAICDTCLKPDIYLIVTDEYAGDKALKETMNFDNIRFKDSLKQKGFYLPLSSSNYVFTAFSVSSMLEMEYLQNISGNIQNYDKDLSKCYKIIRENQTYQILKEHGYALHNYSVFDIHDQPAIIKESFLPGKTRFITAQTLFQRLNNNVLFNMSRMFGTVNKKKLMLSHNSNTRALDSLHSCIIRTDIRPRFVYTHLFMPHYPYYFDSSGKMHDYATLDTSQTSNTNHYIQYVQYTNKVLLELFEQILTNQKRETIIILVSDHGFRYLKGVDKKYQSMNQLAIYLPGKNYEGFYDGISNVNLFRILLNKQFHQNFPMLKDSTSYIRP